MFGPLDVLLQLFPYVLTILFFAVLVVRAVRGLPTWMTERALAAFRAGRPDRAVTWARRALACRPPAALTPTAYHVAGLGLAEQGRLAEADHCFRQSAAAATAARRPDLAARAQAMTATLLARQGYLEEALAAARLAGETDGAERGTALVTQARVLRAQGRWAEARLACRQAMAARTSGGSAPQGRRVQASLFLALAWAEAGEAEATGDPAGAGRAWEVLEEAGTAAEGDDKLHLWCEATAAWVEALRGNVEEVRRVIPLVEIQIPRFRHSRHTLTVVYAALARAALRVGDLDRSLRHGQSLLALEPDLPDQVGGHYFQGECLWRQGKPDAAQAAWRQALALNVDTFHARLAHARLAEAAGVAPTEPVFDRRGPQSTVWPPPPKSTLGGNQ